MFSDTRLWLAVLALSILINLFAVTEGLVQILCSIGISAIVVALYRIEPRDDKLPE